MSVNVFLSFSGERSRLVAEALYQWLPNVIQSALPFISSHSIDSGSRWGTEVSQNLQDGGIGVLCMTDENLDAPWILFEAGSLSKSLSSRVIPYLIDVPLIKIQYPLAQFQSVLSNKVGTLNLLKSVNNKLIIPINDERLENAFERWWPDLEKSIELTKTTCTVIDKPDEGDLTEAIGRLIQSVQQIRMDMSIPEMLVSPQYLEASVKNALRSEHERIESRHRSTLTAVNSMISEISRCVDDAIDPDTKIQQIKSSLYWISKEIGYYGNTELH